MDAVEVEMVCFNTKAVSSIFSFLAEIDATWTRRLVLFSSILARSVAIFLLSRDPASLKESRGRPIRQSEATWLLFWSTTTIIVDESQLECFFLILNCTATFSQNFHYI